MKAAEKFDAIRDDCNWQSWLMSGFIASTPSGPQPHQQHGGGSFRALNRVLFAIDSFRCHRYRYRRSYRYRYKYNTRRHREAQILAALYGVHIKTISHTGRGGERAWFNVPKNNQANKKMEEKVSESKRYSTRGYP